MSKIYIPKKDPTINKSGVIKITPEAIDCLFKVATNTNMSIKQIASMIIVQAVKNDMIEYSDPNGELPEEADEE